MSIAKSVTDVHKRLAFPEDFFSVLQRCASAVDKDEARSRRFRDGLRAMKSDPPADGFEFDRCREVLRSVRKEIDAGSLSAADGALLVAAAAAECIPRYERRHISAAVFADTFGDITVWARDCLAKTGAWGITELPWFSHHLSLRLFALDRLQFELTALDLPYSRLEPRHNRNQAENRGAIYAVKGNLPCTADGFLRTPDDPPDIAAAFTTRYETLRTSGDTQLLVANTVREGVVLPRQTAFDRRDWTEQSLCGGERNVLDVHIPATGPLDTNDCLASFGQARRFPLFARHAPVGFSCHSWLLDPYFIRRLPETSRIRRFSSLFDIVPPVSVDYGEGLSRVFPVRHETGNPSPLTSLQKTVRDWLAGGALFRQGQGLRFTP